MINRDDRDKTNHLLEKLKPFPKKRKTNFLLPYEPNSYVPTPEHNLARKEILNALIRRMSPGKEQEIPVSELKIPRALPLTGTWYQ